MSKKKQFSDQDIDDLFSKVDIPLKKDKDLIWAEKFESLLRYQSSKPFKNTTVFRLYWQYGIAASFVILLAVTFYIGNEHSFTEEAKVTIEDSEQDLLADQTMIESLFVEDNDFDEWFEEQYVLSSVN